MPSWKDDIAQSMKSAFDVALAMQRDRPRAFNAVRASVAELFQAQTAAPSDVTTILRQQQTAMRAAGGVAAS